MRERIKGLTDAVRQVLQEHKGALSGKEICCEIKDRNLVRITPEQEEITFGQPKFYHSVRRTLLHLVRRGEIMRVSRGMYEKHALILKRRLIDA